MRPQPIREAATGPDPLSVITDAYSQAAQGRLPKVAQLYNAVVDAIATGQLEGGSKLPGERELSDALGISLGTAQKSLGLLSRDGQIVREHGRGSFVQGFRRPLHELWHYRFRTPDTDTLLPVYAHLVGRRLLGGDGPWAGTVGDDRNGFVEIERRIDVDGRFSCWSSIVLGASRFGRLLDLPAAAIENVNLKALLFREFDAPTIAVRQSVRIGSAPGRAASVVGQEHGCLILQITALTRHNEPISFQTIVVPATPFAMELGSESNGTDETPRRTRGAQDPRGAEDAPKRPRSPPPRAGGTPKPKGSVR